ncbi:MAG: acyl-CoA synthetase [SAR86 cluster bacterium]|uniref:Acyl-CoA synthetase n=1 Tax=SAR86 cluster bacterium TaxID=2030880 RepID=A0A2A5B2Z9_9GAMM|nr:MAG: acyl-CoA synthetase [SAR86 cluster bacterium]
MGYPCYNAAIHNNPTQYCEQIKTFYCGDLPLIDLSKIPTAEPILETISKVEEFEQTPLLEQFPFTDSYNLLMHAAKNFGDATALEFLLQGLPDEPSTSISFTELGTQITRTANLLNKLGIKENDAVSIILPILPQTHFAIWGAQAAGISNPINPMLEAEHMGEIIAAANAKVVICLGHSAHSDIREKVLEAVSGSTTVTTILEVNIPGLCDPQAAKSSNSAIDIMDYDSSILTMNGDKLDSDREFNADQIAAFFHTGGTTGRPKLAQLTHGNMAFLGQLMQIYTAHMEHHTVLCGLPLFHIYGCIIQGVAAFAVGYRIVLMTPSGFRSPVAMKNFWHHIARFQVKQFSAVPTVLMALADLPVADADISCLTNINSGAAPLSLPFKLSFEKEHNVEVGNGYGMTETTALISRAPMNQAPGSVGMRIPYSQIRIAQMDGTTVTKDCPLGESGAILVKGPQVFKGYKSETDNASAWVEDGWFNTGDLGYMDDEGFLFLSGRAKDLIIRSGHNIDPDLIEEPLNAHSDVVVSIAIGLPDPYAGELPMAYVVKTPGSNITEEELIEHCRKEMSERALFLNGLNSSIQCH